MPLRGGSEGKNRKLPQAGKDGSRSVDDIYSLKEEKRTKLKAFSLLLNVFGKRIADSGAEQQALSLYQLNWQGRHLIGLF